MALAKSFRYCPVYGFLPTGLAFDQYWYYQVFAIPFAICNNDILQKKSAEGRPGIDKSFVFQDWESSETQLRTPVLSIVQVSTVASSSRIPDVAVAVKELLFPTTV